MDGYERKNVVENKGEFLKKMEMFSPYMVGFQEDGSMISKQYPSDCAISGPNHQPCILITHDESTFSANDRNHQEWIKEEHAFL